MTHRPSPSDSSARHEATGGYFTPLVAAKYLLLTTHSQDDTLRSTPVPAVADGDRAYFWTWSRSATRKRLQHTGWVQVAACTMGGICNYGPTLDASARPLAGAEASQASAKLAGKHRGRLGILSARARRLRGMHQVYYELEPDEAADMPGPQSP